MTFSCQELSEHLRPIAPSGKLDTRRAAQIVRKFPMCRDCVAADAVLRK